MRPSTVVLCSAATVLAMTACGSPTGSTGSTGRTGTSPPSVFPLTITRTGGIAGFNDVLVVSGDGLVTVTQKGQAKRQCRLTAEAAKRLSAAAAKVPWADLTPSSTSASFPDDMVTLVGSPSGGPVRLEDPQVGAAGQVLDELVNDLNGGRSASGMCEPV